MMWRYLGGGCLVVLLVGCGEMPLWNWEYEEDRLFYQGISLDESVFEALNIQAAHANVQQVLPAMMPFLSGVTLSDSQQAEIHQYIEPLANPSVSALAERKTMQEQWQKHLTQAFLLETGFDIEAMASLPLVRQQALAESTAVLAIWNVLSSTQQALAYAHAKYATAVSEEFSLHPRKNLLMLSAEQEIQLGLSASQRSELVQKSQTVEPPLTPASNTLALVSLLSSQQATPEKLLAFHPVFVRNQRVWGDLRVLHELLTAEQRRLWVDEIGLAPVSQQHIFEAQGVSH